MPDAGGWVENWTQRLLTWFSQREVKTPLAFYFRLVGAIVVLVLAGLYFSPPEKRFQIFTIGMWSFAGLALIVALFAAFNVKNLVYGESGHRAETKFKYGTDKKEFGPTEMATMQQTENPLPLPGKEEVATAPSQGGSQ
jgi:Na+/melibiose symporter-like transporter